MTDSSWAACVLVLLGVLSTTGCRGGMPPSIAHPLAGQRAPEFAGTTTEGERVAVPAPPGTTATVLGFWASWCEGCERSVPPMEDLWRAHGHQGLQVVAISQDEHPRAALAAMERLGGTHPVYVDPDHELTFRFHATAIPMVFVIDRLGLVRWVGRDPNRLRAAARAVLAEGP